MASTGAAARKSPPRLEVEDAVARWRVDYQRLEEKHQDLQREHEELQGRYRQLHKGYKTALDRLYRVMGARVGARDQRATEGRSVSGYDASVGASG